MTIAYETWGRERERETEIDFRNSITQRWRLASPEICRQQAGDPIQVQRPEKQEGQWCHSSAKARRLETQEKLMFHLSPKVGKKTKDPAQTYMGNRSSIFSFYSGPLVLFRISTDWISPVDIGEGNFFTQFTDPNVNFIQNHI